MARAVDQLKPRKAPGPDDVPSEIIRAGGTAVLKILHDLILSIWKDGVWPEDWARTVFIPLYKKGDRGQCANYRTIALVSHASKVILRIILERIQEKTEFELAPEQAGF